MNDETNARAAELAQAVRLDEEAEAIAAERIRTAAEQKEDGVEALETLGILGQTSGHKPQSQRAETK